MTSKKSLLQLHLMHHKLKDAEAANPYDPDAHAAIVEMLKKMNAFEVRRKRRRPWLMATILFFLLTILMIIIGYVIWPT